MRLPMALPTLITGATAGIGLATATALARLGGRVIIHGRQATACQQAVARIERAVPAAQLAYVVADLADLDAVACMATEVETRFPDLQVLVHNAGTFSHTRQLSPQGFERTWVVNYLARFVLTERLRGLLQRQAPSRIVDVSGTYHRKGRIHFDDIHLASGYTLGAANNQAKLANVLSTYRLARTLAGTGVTANTLHPGAVYTGSILRAEGFSPLMKGLYRAMRPFLKSPAQGAAPVVLLASDPALASTSGAYFHGRKATRSGAATYDVALQERLWDLSVEMAGPWLGDGG